MNLTPRTKFLLKVTRTASVSFICLTAVVAVISSTLGLTDCGDNKLYHITRIIITSFLTILFGTFSIFIDFFPEKILAKDYYTMLFTLPGKGFLLILLGLQSFVMLGEFKEFVSILIWIFGSICISVGIINICSQRFCRVTDHQLPIDRIDLLSASDSKSYGMNPPNLTYEVGKVTTIYVAPSPAIHEVKKQQRMSKALRDQELPSLQEY
eukprot:TRINITY_DN17542_c0_g1_i1.p1 TRINITY_DN17542_c0_g1~~TRINITY_DN17542_c0_g1_i1.p1  ORF type:complete len:210 (+),score=21.70 TRINITY_DN17542_c0_g1_i1:38-667(+)